MEPSECANAKALGVRQGFKLIPGFRRVQNDFIYFFLLLGLADEGPVFFLEEHGQGSAVHSDPPDELHQV